ncbi:UDP-N-acetylmuramoyl-L-alanyl-D-glutamate--2,6-diaminopimelate ligase [Halarsenatibacter silvermanii]|uniref:UDP-N-acetylmuramoyl-L-alanyl-D-glutamate--2,6-diaminopimelate ligase n=1 Tax=Halarsenatibacter silvermanii TaxID=321763 RepID=A0A1G9JMZ0_9FIRM|nr:UDP-N-acetylmuramoyl-L-alanyl-D-glutamate--2,6-diaminopimelate ligase [Halarsenatibacter silvermanii]SDL38930.1 UDP-N-acetylmuramoylalanyl-D-glutamate--2,6-diaminopimelate ligase [Halarsenatibacter silvermanii]
MEARDLLKEIDWQNRYGRGDFSVADVTQDSRRAEEGFVFLARKGFKTDGHRFIKDAYQRGCRAFIVEELPETLPDDTFFIKVENSAEILGQVAAVVHDHPEKDLDIYGVTGTNGKTTTCYLLYELLNELGFKTGLIGTIKVDAGGEEYSAARTTPEASEIFRYLAEMRDNGCQGAVIEISSHALELNRVDNLILKSAVFTNISQDHLDFHEDMDDYLSAKLSIFDLLDEKEGIGVYNGDDAMIRSGADGAENLYSFSLKEESDFKAEIIEASAEEVDFRLNGYKFNLSMGGLFNAGNAAAALSVLFNEGYEAEKLDEALRGFSGVPGRMEKVENGLGFTILVDYAHTPAGMRNVLRSVTRLKYNDLIVVFGCGGDRDKDKRPKMGKAALEYAEKVFITSDNPRSEKPENIIDDIVSGIDFADYDSSWKIIEERGEAIREAVKEAEKGDILIIFGKGHETYQEFADERINFDDREEARKAVRRIEQ